MSIYESQSVRLGSIGRVGRVEMAKRALAHARHFGSVIVCRDDYGSVWSVWRDGEAAKKVLSHMPETVRGTFEPNTYHFAKTCNRFVSDVVEALT